MFDSGIGGLSVLTEIRAIMPGADLLYVADRARAPYGNRSLLEVARLAHEIADWLVDRGCSTIVVACNTASAAALHSLRGRHPAVPIVGMEPAVKPAAEITKTGVIGVFATAATFQGELFDSVVDRHAGDVEIIATACPGWVDLVERGAVSGLEPERVISEDVRPVVAAGADVLVLGCTHFSFLAPAISAVAGDEVIVYDPAPAVAAQVARVAAGTGGGGRVTLAGSGDLSELSEMAAKVAGITADAPVVAFPS
ncbi:MAG: glutamate racemase [Acidimicrobiia bacterium]|nr:glutamate racemase [Acidimicrobiia bacterium]